MIMLHYSDVQGDKTLSPVFSDTNSEIARRGIYRNFFKRFFDIAVVIASAPFVLPVIALLALIVARDGNNPFYTQARVGRGGREFRFWKLRSMIPNAEAALEAHLAADPEAAKEWERDQKLKNDPRITKIGHVIRKTSLDELPQLWNVLLGDMSLVGPRPMMPSQKSLYPGAAYFELRPGITGYWQISDRNECSFAKRAVFDTTYNNDVSFKTDISVLLKTVGVVFRGTGV